MQTPHPSDAELVRCTANGDASAFAELWVRHSPGAKTVARSYRSLDADDLVAESFSKVYRAIMSGGGPTEGFRAYLFATVRNTAASELKRQTSLSIDRDCDPEVLAQLSVAAPDLIDRPAVARALETLPIRWQHVLWYIGVEKLTAHDAGALLGLSANGVSALASRARRALRRELVRLHCEDLSPESPCRASLTRVLDGTVDEASRAHFVQCSACRRTGGTLTAVA